MVDEAKAFCPGCGFAFVSERVRGGISDYEAKGHTMQLGQTMYNQMLADMGLNISKAPNPVEGKNEPVAPAQPAAPKPVSEPAKPVAKTVPAQPSPPVEQPKKGTNKWLIVAIAAAILLFLAVVIVIAAAVIIFYLRLI